MKFQFNALLLTLYFLLAGFWGNIYAQPIKRLVKETLLTKFNDTVMVSNSFIVSSDLRKIGFCIREKNKQLVMINGIKGNPYDSVCFPDFSHDGKTFFYCALNRSKWLWITGKERITSVDSTSPIIYQNYGPDNKSRIAVFSKESKYLLNYRNNNSKLYDAIEIGSIRFSNDGLKVAYRASTGKKQIAVFDGKEDQPFDQVGYPIISLDGNHLAYWAIDDKKSFAVIDNIRYGPYDEIRSIKLSQDGKHYAYHAIIDRKHVVVKDNVVSEKYVFAHSLCLSQDGLRLGYGFQAATPDKSGFKECVFVDGVKKGPFETIVENSLKFSPNGKGFIFKAEIHDAFFMVLNDKEGTHYSDVYQATAVFSPDNLRFAYVVENDTKRFVNINGVEGERYQDIYSINFSPDSRHIVYPARMANKDMVVVNGDNGKKYDEILGGYQVIFDSPNSFHYMARSGNKIFLVEETIE